MSGRAGVVSICQIQLGEGLTESRDRPVSQTYLRRLGMKIGLGVRYLGLIVSMHHNKGDSRPRHFQGKSTCSGLRGFLSSSLCNLAKFDHLYLTKYRHYHLTWI